MERGNSVAEVAARLGGSKHILHDWIKRWSLPRIERAEACS
jgi:transposase-like protein